MEGGWSAEAFDVAGLRLLLCLAGWWDWSSDGGLSWWVGVEPEWLGAVFEVLFVDEDSGDVLDFFCGFFVIGRPYDFHVHNDFHLRAFARC